VKSKKEEKDMDVLWIVVSALGGAEIFCRKDLI